jgi:phosphoglycerate dehydrogenase-like enzyme
LFLKSNAVIYALSPSFSKHAKLSAQLAEAFENIWLNADGKRFDKQELIAILQKADGVVVGLEGIDDEVLAACPNLKIIAKYGVGLDSIDLEACKKRGVVVGWSGGVNRLSVAEMALGFMLMLCRNLYVTSNQLKDGTWNKSGGVQLSGKSVGIIGFGYIGQELARLLAPFGCKLLVNDIADKSVEASRFGATLVDKEQIFANSDIITVHTPLTKDTKNMIDGNALSMMKKTAFVVNTARGGIVDEAALKKAIKNGDIAGAALDAYLDEPPIDSELLSLPNLICTPHIGGNSEEAVLAMGQSAIKHLKDFFRV